MKTNFQQTDLPSLADHRVIECKHGELSTELANARRAGWRAMATEISRSGYSVVLRRVAQPTTEHNAQHAE